jgi:hypothetical protein
MDEQRVPNLQEMDEQQAHRFLTDFYPATSPKRNTTRVTPRTA